MNIQLYKRTSKKFCKGRVSGIMYGSLFTKPQSIESDCTIIDQLAANRSFLYRFSSFSFEGKEMRCFVREVQLHLTKACVIHFDLLSHKEDQVVVLPIIIDPINSNRSPLMRQNNYLERRCKTVLLKGPFKDMPEVQKVDMSTVESNKVYVRDLSLPSNITAVTPDSTVVIRIA